MILYFFTICIDTSINFNLVIETAEIQAAFSLKDCKTGFIHHVYNDFLYFFQSKLQTKAIRPLFLFQRRMNGTKADDQYS